MQKYTNNIFFCSFSMLTYLIPVCIRTYSMITKSKMKQTALTKAS